VAELSTGVLAGRRHATFMQQDVAVTRIEGLVVDLTRTHAHRPKTADDQAKSLAISGGRDRRRPVTFRFSGVSIFAGQG
jgi:hypothetical protein